MPPVPPSISRCRPLWSTALCASFALGPAVPSAAAQDADSTCATVRVATTGATDPAAPLLRLAYAGGLAPYAAGDFRRPSDRLLRPTCPLGPLRGSDDGSGPGLIEISVAPARAHGSLVSAFPEQRLDGRLFPARGWSALLQAGANLRVGPLTVGLRPELVTQEHREFATVVGEWGPARPLGYPFATGIDLPQRVEGGTRSTADLGQSFVRLDAFGVKLGWSRENLVYGPARHNPLLLGNTAAGFPHVFIGTSREIESPIGGFDLETFWGHVRESSYFDDDPTNDDRLLSGITASWRVPVLDGLRLGGSRLFMAQLPFEGLGLIDQLKEPWLGLVPNDVGTAAENQMIGLFARWAPRRAGIEVYGEWAREDFWDKGKDLLRELDHSQAWTVGLLWLGEPRGYGGRWGLGLEHTHLIAAEAGFSGRPFATFYGHTSIRQGMTHEGQLLGAPIGPGSLASIVEVWHLHDAGASALDVRYIEHDVDAAVFEKLTLSRRDRDREWIVGVRHDQRVGPLWLGAALRYGHRPNRVYLETLTDTRPEPSSWTFAIDAVWREVPRVFRF